MAGSICTWIFRVGAGLGVRSAAARVARFTTRRTRRGGIWTFELAIEPPDHPSGDLDCVALSVVGGNELVDEALGVNPTERVVADVELPGVVGQDDGVCEPVLGDDRTPQRAFAGQAHGIG